MEDSSLTRSFAEASVSQDEMVQMESLEEIPTDMHDEDSPYVNMSCPDHIVLETKSFYTKATDVDNHESVRQIPLSALAEGKLANSNRYLAYIKIFTWLVFFLAYAGGEGSEDRKFEVRCCFEGKF